MLTRINFLAICISLCLQSCSQTDQDKNELTITNAKLLSFALEKIPNSKYKHKTVFAFQDDNNKIIKMNVPCDPSMRGTFVFGNYQCLLQIDSVYQIQLQKITLSSIPANLKNTEGFFYTTKYVEQIDNSSKIRLKSNVKETERDKIQILSDYIDIDGSLYRVINLSPDRCKRLRN